MAQVERVERADKKMEWIRKKKRGRRRIGSGVGNPVPEEDEKEAKMNRMKV